jgi:hypothetical protein
LTNKVSDAVQEYFQYQKCSSQKSSSGL